MIKKKFLWVFFCVVNYINISDKVYDFFCGCVVKIVLVLVFLVVIDLF